MPPKNITKSVGNQMVAVHQLEDIMANVLAWLCVEEIMQKRRVCKKWKEAVKKTIVPLGEFSVNSMKKYNAVNVMTRALPNLQQITLSGLGYRSRHKYNDGEDPYNPEAARTAHYTTHDIEIISNFSELRYLKLEYAPLNGRYPFLFNSFPLLQKLSIDCGYYLKWDLEMLGGLPLLKELECISNHRLTGNINSLRVLKDTLEEVTIHGSHNVEGNFMDLADFPHLKLLRVQYTALTGDIRDIGENHFPSLGCLELPKGVYGGYGCEFQRISDGPELMKAVYLLKKQRPSLKEYHRWYGELSEDSPDWYEPMDVFRPSPPFKICLVQAGSRIGYQWDADEYGDSDDGNPCEVNWLDPEPDRESGDYDDYIEALQEIDGGISMCRGFHQPPTEEEYNSL